MQHHVFENNDIPKGAFHVDEECLLCGLLRRKYLASGRVKYFHTDGMQYMAIPYQCGPDAPKPYRPPEPTGKYPKVSPIPKHLDRTLMLDVIPTTDAPQPTQQEEMFVPNKEVFTTAKDEPPVKPKAEPKVIPDDHRWKQEKILNGNDHVMEECYDCNMKSLRFATSTRMYMTRNGGLSYTPWRKCPGKLPKPIASTDPDPILTTPEAKGRRHHFRYKEIPLGSKRVTETCDCGVQRVRYSNGGAIQYVSLDGKIVGKPWKICDAGLVTIKKPLPEPPRELCDAAKRFEASLNKPNETEAELVRKLEENPPTEFTGLLKQTSPEDKDMPQGVINVQGTIAPETLKEFVKEWHKPLESGYLEQRKTTLPTPAPEATSLNADDEARLTELLVMVQLMYEDLVKHDVRTTSRQMAGRFLYSQGFTELVAKLDQKHALAMQPAKVKF